MVWEAVAPAFGPRAPAAILLAEVSEGRAALAQAFRSEGRAQAMSEVWDHVRLGRAVEPPLSVLLPRERPPGRGTPPDGAPPAGAPAPSRRPRGHRGRRPPRGPV